MKALELIHNQEIIVNKNAKEEFRISIIEYKGHKLLNLRVWFRGEDGQLYPGKQGMSIRMEKAEEFSAAIDKTLRTIGG